MVFPGLGMFFLTLDGFSLSFSKVCSLLLDGLLWSSLAVPCHAWFLFLKHLAFGQTPWSLRVERYAFWPKLKWWNNNLARNHVLRTPGFYLWGFWMASFSGLSKPTRHQVFETFERWSEGLVVLFVGVAFWAKWISPAKQAMVLVNCFFWEELFLKSFSDTPVEAKKELVVLILMYVCWLCVLHGLLFSTFAWLYPRCIFLFWPPRENDTNPKLTQERQPQNPANRVPHSIAFDFSVLPVKKLRHMSRKSISPNGSKIFATVSNLKVLTTFIGKQASASSMLTVFGKKSEAQLETFVFRSTLRKMKSWKTRKNAQLKQNYEQSEERHKRTSKTTRNHPERTSKPP